jgi:hypothetical protein
MYKKNEISTTVLKINVEIRSAICNIRIPRLLLLELLCIGVEYALRVILPRKFQPAFRWSRSVKTK